MTLNGKPFMEVYMNNCGVGYVSEQTCNNYFHYIVFVPEVYAPNKSASSFFTVNSKNTSIQFILFKDISINDKSFQTIDDILGRVVSSLKLPN